MKDEYIDLGWCIAKVIKTEKKKRKTRSDKGKVRGLPPKLPLPKIEEGE